MFDKETRDVLEDTNLMKQIRASLKDIALGQIEDFKPAHLL